MTVNPKLLKKYSRPYSQRNELDSMGKDLLEGSN